MAQLKSRQAQRIVAATLKAAREASLKPVAVSVYDARGALVAFQAEDGTSLKRGEIAMGKAFGAIALGVTSRVIGAMAVERPHFIAAATHAIGGPLIPAPGGVFIRDAKGALLGAVGVSGDTSDNDEAVACAGVAAAGLVADKGA
ncbi:MAG: heme-binding protein [Salinarimonadaceae bacterium]|nr:MAG: heme-binding protein [Salinarimonadaceae bacterium]